MNTIILSGRLTKKPELKTTNSGKSVCEFNIAVDRGTLDAQGNRQADFITCQVWNKSAENLVKYQDKGNKIGLTGVMRVDKYDDKDGNTRYKTYVLVNSIEFLENKKTAETPVQKEEPQDNSNDQVYIDFGNSVEYDDNLAF